MSRRGKQAKEQRARQTCRRESALALDPGVYQSLPFFEEADVSLGRLVSLVLYKCMSLMAGARLTTGG